MIVVDEIKNNLIAFNNDQSIHTREYYNYCLSLIKKWLGRYEGPVNVIFGNYDVSFSNYNRTIKIDIQFEHTLVKDGGRSVNEKIYGNIKNENGFYLVRIDNFNYYNTLDYIIEYSLPNIENIKSCGMYDDFLSKTLYVAPTLYEPNFKGNKTDIITLFDSTGNTRRKNILNQLKELEIDNKEINNCFSHECLLEIYKKTKIMVNVHQTDHHHTFEELRVLPALLNGVIVVSENVPLKEKIPYNEFIIWCDYNEISNKTLEVKNNYGEYYNKLFTNSKLETILNSIRTKNLESFNIIK
jgi:hypothetical protein